MFSSMQVEAHLPARGDYPGKGKPGRTEESLTGFSSILSMPIPNSGNLSGNHTNILYLSGITLAVLLIYLSHVTQVFLLTW